MPRIKSSRQLSQTALAPETIGFRLDEHARRVLGGRAARLGVSAHELARSYLLEILSEQEERMALRQALIDLAALMNEFRESHALGVEALLVSAGKLTCKDAGDWADANLLCSQSPNP